MMEYVGQCSYYSSLKCEKLVIKSYKLFFVENMFLAISTIVLICFHGSIFPPAALFISYLTCEILNNSRLTFTLIHNKKLQGHFSILNLSKLKNMLELGFYVEKRSSSQELQSPPILSYCPEYGEVKLIP